MKELELKTVWELSPDEMQELDLQEGEELSLFEGDSDYMVIPGKTNDFGMDTVYFFIRSDKNMVITSYETEYSNELLEFCKGQDTSVSRIGVNTRSESGHREYMDYGNDARESFKNNPNLKIAYRGGCGYVYTLFEYVENHELFEYLDGFEFVGEFEVINAIEDFFKNGEGTSWGELSEYQELAREWMESRNVKFD